MTEARRTGLGIRWQGEDCTRVPFEVFSDRTLYDIELERIFAGPHWQYLALEREIPAPGDYATTYFGERRVVVTRAPDGEIHAFENRCVHRGAQVVTRLRGNAERFNCPYHMWCYDLAGRLTAVPQQKGVKGRGGMPADFALDGRGMRRLRVARAHGLVFGTFAAETQPLEDYIGPGGLAQIARIASRPIRVLGYYRQVVEANWKLYAENTRDPYHAPLLHLFHVSFGIQTPAMRGGCHIGPGGKHNCILAVADPDQGRQDADAHRARQHGRGRFRGEGADPVRPARRRLHGGLEVDEPRRGAVGDQVVEPEVVAAEGLQQRQPAPQRAEEGVGFAGAGDRPRRVHRLPGVAVADDRVGRRESAAEFAGEVADRRGHPQVLGLVDGGAALETQYRHRLPAGVGVAEPGLDGN